MNGKISSLLVIIITILYTSCSDKHPVKIYIMAGQSNMEGPGQTKYLEENDLTNMLEARDDVWCVYAGRVSGPLKPGYGFRRNNFGPELLFGHVLGDELENELILFKSSIGGTTLHEDWRPPSAVKRAGGKVGPLYNDMIRRFHTMIRNLKVVYPKYEDQGFEIAGFIWFQGESDCCQKTDEGIGFEHFYKENLDDFINDVRNDIGVPELPFIIVQINNGVWDGRSCGGGPLVREIERAKADSEENISLVVTMDLNDGYHYDSPSHIIIGKRIAEATLPFAEKAVQQDSESISEAGKMFFERTRPSGFDKSPGKLHDGLIGYWKFDEGKGSKIFDSSTESNNGDVEGVATWTEGLIGKAVRLNGENNIVINGFKEPPGDLGTIENLSVSFWIQTPGKAGHNRIGKGKGHKLNYEDDTGWFLSEQANDAGWDIGNFDYDGFPHFTATLENEGAQSAYISWGEPPLNGDGFEWHHVAAVYNGSEGSMKIYCDNHLAGEQRVSLKTKGILPADIPLKIGGGLIQENNYQSFDELAIWSRPLSSTEITTLFNNGTGLEL